MPNAAAGARARPGVWVRPVSTSASGRRSSSERIWLSSTSVRYGCRRRSGRARPRRARRTGPRACRRTANGGASARSPRQARWRPRSGCRQPVGNIAHRRHRLGSTRARVSGSTFSGWRSTRDTVILVTPASAATSAIVAPSPGASSLRRFRAVAFSIGAGYTCWVDRG